MRKFLINLLGGYTHSQILDEYVKAFEVGTLSAYVDMESFAKILNGIPPEDWCKLMYNRISMRTDEIKARVYNKEKKEEL